VGSPAADSGVPDVATFSIVAVDTVHGEWGVAVASKFLAVGSVVPWARAGVGAVATQAAANTRFGEHGLLLLERGHSAADVLKILLRADPDPETRQMGIVDALGRGAVFTGDECQEWAGGVKGPGFAVQGNLLAGPEVVDLMSRVFLETRGSLADRMLTALEAGEAAGGDSRGKQSAAIVVVKAGGGYRGGNDRLVDLRVDDAEEPVVELRRLYQMHATVYLPNVHIRLGDEALASGVRKKAEREFSRAIRLYQDAIERNSGDGRIKNALAWFYVQHRVNLDEAFRLAEEARRLDRLSWEVIDTLAEIHFVRGNVVKARDHAVKALQMSPQNSYLESQVDRFQLAVREEERR
jgi:uncharacterized Ntn-hydrolase superfamily protein